MDLLQEVEVLRRVPMFSRLDPPKLKLLAFTSQYLILEDREELFHRGEPADAAYVIVSGLAEVLSETKKGAIPIALMHKNQLFGEMGIIDNAPRSATIRAKGKLTLLRIADDMFLQLITENPQVALAVMRELSAKLANNLQRFNELEEKLRTLEENLAKTDS